MKHSLKRSLGVVLVLSMAVACATVQPGQDPVLVRAQQSYKTAVDSCDLAFKLELNNRELIEKALPGTHATVDKIKTEAKVALPALLAAIDSYAATKDQAALVRALAVVDTILAHIQGVLAALPKEVKS